MSSSPLVKLSFALGIVLFSFSASGENLKTSRVENNLRAEDLVQMYRKDFSKETVRWSAPSDLSKYKEISTDHGIKIFYPECFKVEDFLEEDLSKITESNAIIFVKTADCAVVKDSKYDLFLFERQNDSSSLAMSFSAFNQLLYQESFELNGNRGLLEVQLGYGYFNNSKEKLPSISYRTGFECKFGKNSHYFHATINTQYGEESWKILKSKNYSLPSDVKEILSTFKCVKPKLKYP